MCLVVMRILLSGDARSPELLGPLHHWQKDNCACADQARNDEHLDAIIPAGHMQLSKRRTAASTVLRYNSVTEMGLPVRTYSSDWEQDECWHKTHDDNDTEQQPLSFCKALHNQESSHQAEPVAKIGGNLERKDLSVNLLVSGCELRALGAQDGLCATKRDQICMTNRSLPHQTIRPATLDTLSGVASRQPGTGPPLLPLLLGQPYPLTHASKLC